MIQAIDRVTAKERAIPFTKEMRRAVLADRKTQTRRICKSFMSLQVVIWDGSNPYGKPGDRLYITEPTQIVSTIPAVISAFSPDTASVQVQYDDGEILEKAITLNDFFRLKERKDYRAPCNARFMLKSFARYWLEVVDVRLERLQDVSEEDAIAEGCSSYEDPELGIFWTTERNEEFKARFNGVGIAFQSAKAAFCDLWDSINGDRPGCSWADNPWAWCIAFRRLAP